MVPLAFSVTIILLSLNPAHLHAGQEEIDPPRPWPRTCPDSSRFGWALVVNWIDVYGDDLAQLNAGWYQNFGVLGSPPHPFGLGFVQTIRLSNDGPYADKACGRCPAWTVLQGIAQANPGSLWLIGNEIDTPHQDGIYPDRYAELYHDLFRFLKAVDPSSQVAIGGIVQPTPLRLTYLDMVLDEYRSRYGRQMPMDVFNAHNYILREELGSWGCVIPPGLPDTQGMLYELEDHYSMQIWIEQLMRLRTWMRDRGYRDLPLIISEYGILFYDGLGGCSPEITRDFMRATFDWMMETTDPDLGYPEDGNHLVQAWNWYSLDHGGVVNEHGDPVWLGLSHLFDPESYQITNLGIAYAEHTTGLDPSPAIDLVVTGIGKIQSEPDPGGQVTITVTAQVSNWGTETASPVLVRFESDSLPLAEDTIDSVASGESKQATVVWTGLHVGEYHTVTATADPQSLIGECYEDNNRWSSTLFIGDRFVHFPMLSSGY
jgi:hypothetical protein